ncbi:MAG: tRNA (adenosine(37)-N6)-threonylcarbamoyltransferase complex ATPase subunit type 1 TsaE [Desulfobacca sp.]|uniref:tRNA (adenosine(37)-N6)-threonylcarbamoyltransferase complex ATPase subunit type 1 TsaE n=1 Tax=Desulfobacca sp. TaxID=2067990 RepID=UPI004048F521
MQVVSHSPAETQAWGAALATLLQPGDVILLHGDLGAGKTELVRGLALGLGLPPEEISSPTFALIHEYPGKMLLVHVDLYRLPAVDEDFLRELEDYWQRPVITVIEWAERLEDAVPAEYLDLSLQWLGGQSRLLTIAGYGRRGEDLARACGGLAAAQPRRKNQAQLP